MTRHRNIINFSSSYLQLPDTCYQNVVPAGASSPEMLAFNNELAADFGLSTDEIDIEQKLNVFSGNHVVEGSTPVAFAYAGHQFGHFSPQLGDGRALLLGELLDVQGHRKDVQLKGSGRTPFSRGGDGRSALGPVIREYLVSEAMHAMNVPTTRALSAIATGEYVVREAPLPGGILTRVASSHLRVGTLQFFAARAAHSELSALVDFAIDRHYPSLNDADCKPLALFDAVASAQASLVAKWMSIGFIHGVMNTDNMTLSGETIDYGPCAFMDHYRADQVFSSIDSGGRYAYNQQPRVLQWNLARLAESLLLLEDKQDAFEEILHDVPQRFETAYLDEMRKKMGLLNRHDDDATLISAWLTHLENEGYDYTLAFASLADARRANADSSESDDVLQRWRQRIASQPADSGEIDAAMRASNPTIIPRNHQIERVIQAAYDGDYLPFTELHDALKTPYVSRPDSDPFIPPPTPDERVTQTFCGT
ncbi:MAG: YdiU family protein [Pseudomonadota bacterium]